MQPLPIDAHLPDICAALSATRRLVLVAEPGAGKTTRIPPALLRAGGLSPEHPALVMLQPRRVAARAAAQRIADENGWQLGQEVGYQIRFEKKIGPATRLRVVTEGILTRQLVADPFLEGVGAVLLDEFHERSLHTDLALALLKEIQTTVRHDLMILIMSATLDAEPVAAYLHDAPILRVPGRTFPVTITHTPGQTTRENPLPDRAARAVLDALSPAPAPGLPPEPSAPAGDLLVFLPGAEEIRRTIKRLEPFAADRRLLLLPLHGALASDEQRLALQPAPPGLRKVICATNIAETSLTIEGVTTVIDSGLARIASYDPRRGLDRLELQRISRASATQRAGRAGRTAPGRCIRLWNLAEDRFLKPFEIPEIQRVDLAATVLALHAWGKPDPRTFAWFDPPADETLAAAERLLTLLGAITAERAGTITPLGRQMLALPVHPRLARLLLAAAEGGLLQEGCTIAALLSEKDLVPLPARSPDSRQPAFGSADRVAQAASAGGDLWWRRELLSHAEAARFAPWLRNQGIDPHAARQIARTRDDLLRIARRLASRPAPPPDQRDLLLFKLPLLAYPDRVVRRRPNDPTAGLMVGGSGIRQTAESQVRQGDFYVALDARHDPRNPAHEAAVRVASPIDPAWLQELFPQEIHRDRRVLYDAERDRVLPLCQTLYRDLVLEEDRHGIMQPEEAAAALVEAARAQLTQIFAAHPEAARLMQRIALLRQAMPEHPWPVLDEAQLASALQNVAQGKKSIAELREAPLAAALRSLLPYPLDRLLDEQAPETITVPSGSRIKIDYSSNPPVLAVRLQELFGCTQTPRIAAGRVPLLLHLLSPAFRPVQVTHDLASFWRSAYFEVRKDLRIRYPKHAWPEDPLTAKPVAKGRPRP